MKKVLTTAFASFYVLFAGAQQNLINGSFEDTVIINDHNLGMYDTIAADWTGSGFGFGLTDDAVEGNTAAYVWNWYFYAKGILTNGDANFPGKGGTPINFRPDALTGSYKYITGDIQSTGDSGIANVCLTKFNTITQQRDTVGFGSLKLGPEDTYKTFEVAIDYRNSNQPDTVTVTFISSENGFCSNQSDGNCLFLYVDDLNLSNASTGINESLTISTPFLYPNPAQDMLTVSFPGKTVSAETVIGITSITGERVIDLKLRSGAEQSVNINHLATGVYSVRIEREGQINTIKLIKR